MRFLAGLCLLFSIQAFAKDVVFIVYNDVQADDHYLLDQLQQPLKRTMIGEKIKEMNPEFVIDFLASDDLEKLPEQILENIGEGNHLRGLVFTGHGNSSVYSPSKSHYYRGVDMARILKPIINAPNLLSTYFTLYFSGCKMAKLSQPQGFSFQRELNLNLIFSRPYEAKDSPPFIDIIAHEYPVGDYGLRKSFSFERYLVNTGVGRFYERYNSIFLPYVGAHSQNLVWFLTVGAAFTSLFVLKQHEGVTAFSGILAFQYLNFLFTFMAEASGRLTGLEMEEGAVYSLMKKSLTRGCAEALAEISRAP